MRSSKHMTRDRSKILCESASCVVGELQRVMSSSLCPGLVGCKSSIRVWWPAKVDLMCRLQKKRRKKKDLSSVKFGDRVLLCIYVKDLSLNRMACWFLQPEVQVEKKIGSPVWCCCGFQESTPEKWFIEEKGHWELRKQKRGIGEEGERNEMIGGDIFWKK